MDGLSTGDLALMKDSGLGENNSFLWIFALLILAGGGFGGLFGNRNGEFGQYATAASQSEILLGQQFQGLDNKIDRIGNGIADATYALNNTITGEGRNVQMQLANCCCENQRNVDSVRFDMANYAAQTNATVTTQTQKILDAICTNRMADMQNQINALQLQNAVAGVVKYPMSSSWAMNGNPFCGCGVS